MPRFSIKDLILAVTLVAVGLAICLAALSYHNAEDHIPLVNVPRIILAAFGAGAAMIGAGILTPFQRKTVGAAIGLVLGGVVLAVLTAK
jgi:hypothetical protein